MLYKQQLIMKIICGKIILSYAHFVAMTMFEKTEFEQWLIPSELDLYILTL